MEELNINAHATFSVNAGNIFLDFSRCRGGGVFVEIFIDQLTKADIKEGFKDGLIINNTEFEKMYLFLSGQENAIDFGPHDVI